MRRSSFYNFLILVIIMSSPISLSAQQVDEKLPWSVRMTESEMIRCPESWQLDFQPKLKWDYCHGLELGAMLDVYDAYGDKKIRDYAIAYADTMVHEDGSITAYKLTDYSLDRINSGKILFRIYEQTKDEKYKKALDLLYSQFAGQPRNEDGGFWHKKIYPHQMWLDGLYMGAPFYAEYAYRNNRPQDYADVINQFITCARHTYDPKNGLYRHACDVSRTERWADPVTGQSKHCWGRALGWYAMALVDALDFIVKPVDNYSFLLKMTRILDRVAIRPDDMFCVCAEGEIISLHIRMLRYLTVDGHYVIYHSKEGTFAEYITLNAAEKKLNDPAFFRCDRGCLVNLRYVEQIRKSTCLVDGEELPIARTQFGKFKQAYARYLGGLIE